MPNYRYHTMRRIENVVRIREYVETSHYEGDAEMTDNIKMVHENYIALRELGEYMIKADIYEFDIESHMEQQALIFA